MEHLLFSRRLKHEHCNGNNILDRLDSVPLQSEGRGGLTGVPCWCLCLPLPDPEPVALPHSQPVGKAISKYKSKFKC